MKMATRLAKADSPISLDAAVAQEIKPWKRWMRKGATIASGIMLYGTLTVLSGAAHPANACTDGETRPCPAQAGVCLDHTQTCSDNEWQACDAPGYQSVETFCDRLDNDCDGRVDIVDQDGDGANACRLHGIVNELLLTNLDAPGSIKIFEYKDGEYQEAWATIDPDSVDGASGGGEMGDLDGDGIPEFVVNRSVRTTPPSITYRLEAWKFDSASQGWAAFWSKAGQVPYKIGDIADVDNDGVNELLVTDRGESRLDLYSLGGDGLVLEKTVRECEGDRGALFHATIGDLNGNGTPEIIFQCDTPEDIIIQEFDGNGYPVIASVSAPNTEWYGVPMVIDDMETGDVNGDGRADAVFCGNSGQVHVLTNRTGTYTVEYSSSLPSELSFSQTCSVGDLTGDGIDDILVINQESAKVISHDGTGYEEIWNLGLVWDGPPGIGTSAIGDADNDGRMEFVFKEYTGFPFKAVIFENDPSDTGSFVNTHSFEPSWKGGMTAIIGNLNPLNDEYALADCDDNDSSRGAGEYCGVDYSRPAAGSGGGVGGTHWSDEFTVCNTAAEERELLFRFTERGDPGQQTHAKAESIFAGACITYSDPVRQWFGQEMYGALLIDTMDGPARDTKVSGIFKGEKDGKVMGQYLGNVALKDSSKGDVYIFTTTDPERNRLGTGFQATQDGTSLEVMLENPIGTVHWRKDLGGGWKAGDNQLFSRIERYAPGVPNLIIHYMIEEGAAVPIGTITDNQSGDPAARLPATPSEYLVMPVIGKTAGRGVDWISEFTIANMAQAENTARLNLYLGGQPLIAELPLGEGEILGYSDLVSQVTWRDSTGAVVPVDDAVGALEITADGAVIAGSKFNSVNRENGELMGLSLKAMTEPNVVPVTEYLFLGVKNEDPTGVSRANVIASNLTGEDAVIEIDVLRQDGTLAGQYEMIARAGRYTNTRVPPGITEENGIYTLRMTSTQPVYAVTTNVNESADAYAIYPLALQK